MRIRIHIVFGSWIWIRIRVNSIEVKIQELSRLKMEPWRAVDAQNGGRMRSRIRNRIRIEGRKEAQDNC
jgi:hypothetical protein